MSAKQTLKQRKALRSAAAKRGWDTRIARERREIEAENAEAERGLELLKEHAQRIQNAYVHREPEHGHREMSVHDLGCWWHRFETDGVLEPYMTPWWPLAHQPRSSLWQRIKGWFA